MDLTKEQIGYIAGIIDGEGHIFVSRCKHKNSCVYTPGIKIANTNLDVILWLKAKLNCGSICIQCYETDRRKTLYRIVFSANHVRKFLPYIIDSLIVKRSQALLLLEFLKFHKRTVKYLTNQERYNFKMGILGDLEKFYQEMRGLNLKGVNEKEGEFGGTPTLNLRQEDNTEPSRDLFPGVCNDYGLSPKGMI